MKAEAKPAETADRRDEKIAARPAGARSSVIQCLIQHMRILLVERSEFFT
jgi:hypothetical protein